MLIAQITDLHIKPERRLAYRRVDTASMLEAAIAHLNALDPRPDVVLATGDLVDAGTADEYGVLRDILAPLKPPLFLLPGNHDLGPALMDAFAQHRHLPRGGAAVNYAIEEYPVRLIALDTTVPGEAGGRVESAHCRWLDERLDEAPDRPTIVFTHHPPFRTGIAHMDRIGLANADALAAVVRRFPCVERVLCGHLHRSIQVRWAGTIASTAPSTAHQVTLDLRHDGPSSFVMEPPGLQLHLWHPDSGVVTHTATIGAFDGPHPFHDGGKLIA
jgi:3',5'-cyclic AMP phosphodiesterase CpdA